MAAAPADGSQQLVRGDTLQWLNLEVCDMALPENFPRGGSGKAIGDERRQV